MSTFLRQARRGVAAGFAATAPMTLFMDAVHALLPRHEQNGLPPEHITARALAKTGVDADAAPGEHDSLSMVAHFAFGATAGSFYTPLAQRLRPHPILGGVAYGLAVWAASYLGWLPAASLYRSALREPARRNLMIIGAHVVWGAVLGAVTETFEHNDAEARTEKERDLCEPP